MTLHRTARFLAFLAIAGCAAHLPPPTPSQVVVAQLAGGSSMEFKPMADEQRPQYTVELETRAPVTILAAQNEDPYCEVGAFGIHSRGATDQLRQNGGLTDLPAFVRIYATPNEIYSGKLGQTPPRNANDPSDGIAIPFIDVATDDGYMAAICSSDFKNLAIVKSST